MKEYAWPESFEEKFEHYHLPKHLKNVLILSDVHLPYHHIPALNEAIEYGLQKKIDSILLNGDILDCYMLSKFQPDPRQRNFGQEIICFQEFIRLLQSVFPKAEIFYKLGNHEERYERIMIGRYRLGSLSYIRIMLARVNGSPGEIGLTSGQG